MIQEYLGKNNIKVKQDKGSWLKLGLNNESGIAAYQINNQIFIKEYDHNLAGPCPQPRLFVRIIHE